MRYVGERHRDPPGQRSDQDGDIPAPIVAELVKAHETQDEAYETSHKTAVLGGKRVFTGPVPYASYRDVFKTYVFCFLRCVCTARMRCVVLITALEDVARVCRSVSGDGIVEIAQRLIGEEPPHVVEDQLNAAIPVPRRRP